MKTSLEHLLKKLELDAFIDWQDFIFLGIDIVIILIIAWSVSRTIKAIISRVTSHMQENSSGDEIKRINTISRVLGYITSVIVVTLTIMTVLSSFGVSVAPLLATAGVAGVAVGFGAQSLVKDYFTGFVMLIEDQIRQGDIVEVAGKNGTVEEVTLRYVRLRDYEGAVHYIPNSAISVVTNRTRSYAYTVMDIQVAYHTDIKAVYTILNQIAKKMCEDTSMAEKILSDLEIAGVDAFAESAISIRCRIKVVAAYQMVVKRAFLEAIKLAFEENHIEIPYRHLVIQNSTKA